MPEITPSRYRVDAGWDSAPHLDEKAKKELLASYPPHMRDARTQGIPLLGFGAVWPIAVDTFTVAPFRLPDYWPRGYALDVGWNRTACLWGARDPDLDVIYLYGEYYVGQEKPAVHAAAIKARGAWIKGCIDPAAQGRSQRDGERLIEDYQAAGLNIVIADNAVEAGVHEVYHRLSTGRLRAFSTLPNFFAEFRRYHRDDKGKIVKKDDHLMDCCRYVALNHLKYFMTEPFDAPVSDGHAVADSLTGY